MVYAVSDLHGCYEKYLKMLELINFSEKDTLYVLGDIVDRGANPIKIIQDIMKRKNVVCLLGNHDYAARRILKYIIEKPDIIKNEEFQQAFYLWLSDGGNTTYEEFNNLNDEEKKKIIDFLFSLQPYQKVKINEKKFLLSHTIPEKEAMRDFNQLSIMDLILGEPDYDLIYYRNIYLVTGHTPTSLIDEKWTGKIYQKNNHIAIDCGAVFGDRLGCICLNNLQEIYTK